jgi:hypothetical protein
VEVVVVMVVLDNLRLYKFSASKYRKVPHVTVNQLEAEGEGSGCHRLG